MKDVHACLGCGKNTTAKCQICDQCVQMRRHSNLRDRDSASAVGPFEEVDGELEHDYSEDALGPHTSDQRWSYEWTEGDL